MENRINIELQAPIITRIKNDKPYLDTRLITDLSNFCENGKNIELIKYLDTSNCTKFYYTFAYADITDIPELDYSKAQDMAFCFSSCSELVEINNGIEVPEGCSFRSTFSANRNTQKIKGLHLNKAGNCSSTFYNCMNLHTLEDFGFPKSSVFNGAFASCKKLENITVYGTIKIDSNDLRFSSAAPLTVESMMNVINALEDNSALDTVHTVTFGANNLAKLTEEQIAVATAKNISLI